jgi:hypothetical protein
VTTIFIECDACRKKPGSPGLCSGCLTNRGTIERLGAALAKIRYAGNDSHPTAIWMQKVAAHAMQPMWPDPGEQPTQQQSAPPADPPDPFTTAEHAVGAGEAVTSKDQVHLEWRRKDEVPDKPWSLVIVHPNGFLWTVLSAAEPMELRHGETTAGLEDLLREVAAHGKRAHSIAAHNLLRKMGLLDPPAHPKTSGGTGT